MAATGVVDLEVELEVLEEVVLAEEVEAGRGVGIVLMAGGFLRLGFDPERSLEPDLLLVGDCHVHEAGEMIHLALEVGVDQGRVALASAPEHIALATQFVRPLQGLLHLGGGEAEGRGLWRGSRRTGDDHARRYEHGR